MRKGRGMELFKYDPIRDAEKTFSIEQGLNENWEKIEQEFLKKGNSEMLILTGLFVQTTSWVEDDAHEVEDYPLKAELIAEGVKSDHHCVCMTPDHKNKDLDEALYSQIQILDGKLVLYASKKVEGSIDSICLERIANGME